MIDHTFQLMSIILSTILLLSTLLCFKGGIIEIRLGKAKWYFIVAVVFFFLGIYGKIRNGEDITVAVGTFYKAAWFFFAWGIYLSAVSPKVRRSKGVKVCKCMVMIFASFIFFGVPCDLFLLESYRDEVVAELYRGQTLCAFYFGIFLQILMLIFALLIKRYEKKKYKIDTNK